MKMSDMFDLPVIVQQGYTGDIGFYTSIVDSNYREIVGGHVINEDAANQVAHCINTHDKLIDLLKQAAGRVVISAADQDELQWLIDAMEVMEGEL